MSSGTAQATIRCLVRFRTSERVPDVVGTFRRFSAAAAPLRVERDRGISRVRTGRQLLSTRKCYVSDASSSQIGDDGPSDIPQVLDGVSGLCESVSGSSELGRTWERISRPLLATNAWAQSLSLLVEAASADDDLSRARRLCLRLLALREKEDEAGEDSTFNSPAGEPTPEVPTTVWTALVGAHARSSDSDAGFALLGRVEAVVAKNSNIDQPKVPANVFEALIGGLVQSRRVELAFDTFQRMRTWALVEPSASLYTMMIRACGIVRDTEKAMTLYDELCSREKNQQPEARAELIIALAAGAKPREAFRLFNEAARSGDSLRIDVCQALAARCGRNGLAQEAKLLQRRMLAAGLAPDVSIQANLVRAFGVAAAARCGAGSIATEDSKRLLAHAWRVVGDARKKAHVPGVVLSALLDGYCRIGLTEHAEKLLWMYPEIGGINPDTGSFSLVFDALAKTGQTTRYRSLWTDMLTRSDAKPSAELMQRCLDIAVSVKDVRWSLSVLELMYSMQVAPSGEAAQAIRSLPVRPAGNTDDDSVERSSVVKARELLRELENIVRVPPATQQPVSRFTSRAVRGVAPHR